MDNNDFAVRFSDALVSEIKAEMGRQDLSSRGLARLIGANAQFVSSRLDGGNPRTGERVLLTVRDLAAISSALGLSEVELVARAESIAAASESTRIGAEQPLVTDARNLFNRTLEKYGFQGQIAARGGSADSLTDDALLEIVAAVEELHSEEREQ